MTRVEAVAQAYGLPTSEVDTWPGRIVDVFHRAALHRGWITPEVTA